MASHMNLMLKEVPPSSLRASATAMSAAVGVTDEHIIIAKAGLFSKKINRYPLATLKSVRFTPNPHSDLLLLEFADSGEMTLMFSPDAKEDVERLNEVLQTSVNKSG